MDLVLNVILVDRLRAAVEKLTLSRPGLSRPSPYPHRRLATFESSLPDEAGLATS